MDNDAAWHGPENISTVVDLLETKELSWAAYQEDMPSTGFTGEAYTNRQTGRNDYVRKHNPAIIYGSIANSPSRVVRVKSLTSFYSDLADDNLPQYIFITPSKWLHNQSGSNANLSKI